jgi:hypothetical protein
MSLLLWGYSQHASLFNQYTSLQNGKRIEFMLHYQKSSPTGAALRTRFKVLKTIHNSNVNLEAPKQQSSRCAQLLEFFLTRHMLP